MNADRQRRRTAHAVEVQRRSRPAVFSSMSAQSTSRGRSRRRCVKISLTLISAGHRSLLIYYVDALYR